jgi:hypothetical protein
MTRSEKIKLISIVRSLHDNMPAFEDEGDEDSNEPDLFRDAINDLYEFVGEI